MTNEIKRGTIYLDELEIGMSRELTKVIGDKEINMFAELSTDYNPVHVDEEYAKNTFFKGRVAHGVITASLISAILGEQLPGHGSIYLKQELKFLAPVRPNDEVRAVVTVKEINTEKAHVKFDTAAFIGETQILSGESLVLAPTRK